MKNRQSVRWFHGVPYLVVSVFMGILTLGIVGAPSAWGVTKTWNGFGNWSSTTKWTPQGRPAAGDSVVVNTGDVLLSATTSVNNMTTQAGTNLNIGNGTLTVAAGLANNGAISVASGTALTINGGTSVNNAGGSIGGGGTLSFNGGSFTPATGSTISVAALNLSGTTVNVTGNLDIPAGTTVVLTNSTTIAAPLTLRGALESSTWTNTISGGLTTIPGSTIWVKGATLTVTSSFTNNGAITLGLAGVPTGAIQSILNVNGVLTNKASIDVVDGGASGNSFRILGGTLVNEGTVTVTTAGLPVTLNGIAGGTGSNSGTMTLNDNVTWNLPTLATTFANSGTISVASGKTLTVSGGSFTNSVGGSVGGAGTTLTFSGTTLSVAAGASTPIFSALNLSGTTVNVGGSLDIPAGTKVYLTNNTSISSPVHLWGGLESVTNTNTISGLLTTETGSTLAVRGANLNVTSGFTNKGAIILGLPGSAITIQSNLSVSGVLINSGTIDFVDGGLAVNSTRTLGGTLVNQGLLRVNTLGLPVTLSGIAGPAGSNSGTMTLNDNVTWNLSTSTFANSGTITVASGKTLTVSGGSFTNSVGGSVGGAGTTLTFSGSTLSVAAGASTPIFSTLNLSGTTVNGAGSLDIPAGTKVYLTNNTSISKPVHLWGGLESVSYTNTISGLLTTETGSTLAVRGANLNVSSGFTNNGAIVLGLPGSAATIQSNLSVSGVLINSGTIDFVDGGTGVSFRTLGGTLVNQGLLKVNTLGLPVTLSGGSFTNSAGGIIEGKGILTVSSTAFSNAGIIRTGLTGTPLYGILTITGPLPTTATSELVTKLGGATAAGTDYDKIAVSGLATLNGTLTVSLAPGYTPANGNTFTLLGYGSRSGAVSANLPVLPPGSKWGALTYNPTTATLNVLPAPILTLTPAGADFGTVASGFTSARSFIINNTGFAPLNVSSIAFSGTNFSEFYRTGGTCQPTPPFSVAVGSSCTVDITFAPTSIAPKSALMTISSDDNLKPTVTANLTGAAVAAVPYSGLVLDTTSTPVAAALAALADNPLVFTATLADGSFTLNGLPSGTPVHLALSKAGFVPAYSSTITTTTPLSTALRPFVLFMASDLSGWGVTAGKGVIRGWVVDTLNIGSGFIAGVTVTAASRNHPAIPYPVTYDTGAGLGGSAKSANGLYYVLNVDPDDVVTVTAIKTGWNFPTAEFVTHADAVSEGFIAGNDIEPPTSILSTPLNGAALRGQITVTGTASDSGSGVQMVDISFDSGPWTPISASASNPWSYTQPQPLMADGPHTISTRTIDRAGNIQTPVTSITVTVDNTAPTAAITSPTAGQLLLQGSSPTITGSAADPGGSGILRVELSFDNGATWIPASGTTLWSYSSWTVPTTGFQAVIMARATDRALNISPITQVTVTIGNTLTLTINGTGTGSIQSDQPGVTCASGTCPPFSLAANVTVNLYPLVGPNSLFTTWSGSCGSNGACSADMTVNRSVTATFTHVPAIHVVTGAVTTPFELLQPAFNSTTNGSMIQARELDFTGPVNAAVTGMVTLQGGYDLHFATRPGYTTMLGTLSINTGTVVVDMLIIK